MFNNRTEDGRNNIIGVKVGTLRKGLHLSQRQLAEKLNELGLVIDKNAIQRIESGQRFVTDIELGFFAKVFDTTIMDLLKRD